MKMHEDLEKNRELQATPEPQNGSQSTSSSPWCAAAFRRRKSGEAKMQAAAKVSRMDAEPTAYMMSLRYIYINIYICIYCIICISNMCIYKRNIYLPYIYSYIMLAMPHLAAASLV